MDSFLQNYDPITRVILQVLLNSLWQGLAIAVLVSIVFRMKQSMSATTRHAIWFVSLMAIGALPFLPVSLRRTEPPSPVSVAVVTEPRTVSFTIQQSSLPDAPATMKSDSPDRSQKRVSRNSRLNTIVLAPAPSVSTSESAVNTAAQTVTLSVAPQSSPSMFSRLSEKIFSGRLPLLLTGLWSLIALYMIGRIVSSYFLMIRLRVNLKPLPDHSRHLMKRMASSFGFRRYVRVRMSKRASVPMTVGLFKPLIVIPEELMSSLSDQEFEGVIAHELAHIKRWDYLTNILQHVIQAYLFFHPAVWLIGKYLNVERELACDDWAVKVTGEPRRYASCLTRLVEELKGNKPLAIATGIFFGKHIISRRVEMILDKNRNASTFIAKPAMLYALSVAIVCMGVCALLSPVIAVPAGKIQTAAAQKPTTPPSPVQKSQPGTEVTPKPVEPPSTLVVTVKPTAPVAISDDDDQDVYVVASTPEAPYSLLKPQVLNVETPSATTLVFDPAQFQVLAQPVALAQDPWQKQAATIDSWGGQTQIGRAGSSADKSTPPAISEAELLTVLSDVVKRDTDPTVRTEALQGIVRLRSDASVNTLISLYDGTTDVKVKGEIIPYLLRRKGDNAKATAKLVSIAKTEKDDELRRSALNQIVRLGGDESINSLIEIYDSLQDPKAKRGLISSFSNSKNRKAVDKLIQIAKTDADPQIRQAAIRALSNVDNRLFLDLSGHGTPMAPPAPEGSESGQNWKQQFGSGQGYGVGSGSGQDKATSPAARPPKAPYNW